MDQLNVLVLLAIVLAAAFLSQKVTDRLRLPMVTGYIIVGVLLGGSLGGVLGKLFGWNVPAVFGGDRLRDFHLVGDLALMLVAFTVGSELQWKNLKTVGRSVLAIALFESLGAFVLVAAGVWFFMHDAAMALILGAVASATAPAATVMVIRQYRSSGPLTTSILAVVGIDDAIALMIYAFAAAIARAILTHQEHISMVEAVAKPVLEIVGALGIGTVLGLLGSWLLRNVRSTDHLLAGAGAMLLLGAGLANTWNLSPLLTNMALGMVVANSNPFVRNRVHSLMGGIAPALYALFFILGGARLDATLLPAIGLLGLVYLLARAAGKMGGATLGAHIGRAPRVVRKFVGFGLIPQVGVAVALAMLVDQQFGGGHYQEDGDRLASWVINILLATTIVTEIVGPMLTRLALQRAGEVNQLPVEGEQS